MADTPRSPGPPPAGNARIIDIRARSAAGEGSKPDPGPPTRRGRPPEPPNAREAHRTYRLEIDIDRPLGFEIQRVLLDEYDRAIDLVRSETDRSVAVHETRKSIKRARATLRLIRDQVGYRIYRQDNVVLRDAARSLSVHRSLAVAGLTARDAVIRSRVEPAKALGIFEHIDSLRADAHPETAIGSQGMVDLTTALLCARSRTESWPLIDVGPNRGKWTRQPIPDTFESIAPGLHRVYRRGRRAMRAAERHPSAATYHAWRKRVRYLRHQMEALHLVWPPIIGGMAESLAELAETLGVEHDLAELADLLAANPGTIPHRPTRTQLASWISAEQRRRRDVAHRLGGRLYHDKPEAFVARLGSYWAAARPPGS